MLAPKYGVLQGELVLFPLKSPQTVSLQLKQQPDHGQSADPPERARAPPPPTGLHPGPLESPFGAMVSRLLAGTGTCCFKLFDSHQI